MGYGQLSHVAHVSDLRVAQTRFVSSGERHPNPQRPLECPLNSITLLPEPKNYFARWMRSELPCMSAGQPCTIEPISETLGR